MIVEDGTGIVRAESYASIAVIDAFWAARTNRAEAALWAAKTTALKEGAAREGKSYLDATFGPYYRGIRAGYVQGGLWPRTGAFDDAGYPLPSLPPELIDANCELAGRAVTSRLAADAARGGAVKRKRSKAGPVETETEWADGATAETKYGFVAGILAPILTGLPGAATWLWR